MVRSRRRRPDAARGEDGQPGLMAHRRCSPRPAGGRPRPGVPSLPCWPVDSQGGSLATPRGWQACVGEPELVPGTNIWIGVDVGGGGQEGDTAVVWISEQLHVGCQVFSGEDGVLQARDLIEELAERYRIEEVAFDPWRAAQIAQELEQRGVRCSAFPQTDARMIPASKGLHRAIVERRLVLPADDVLASHASHAVARQSRRGWRLDRPSRAAGENIDAIVALAMALDRHDNQPEGLEVVGYF